MRRFALALAVVGAGVDASPAHAGGAGELMPPRSVGRAGVGTVSDDGAGAIFTSPAALARRLARRVQLGGTTVIDGLEHRPDRTGAPDARAQGAPRLAPFAAVITGLGPIVVGAGIAVDASGRTFASPDPGLASDSVESLFAYRYAGFSARAERRTAAIAAAARVNDWLAVGATATLATVRLEERRRIWAGFTGRFDPLTGMPLVPGNPAYDLDVAVTGTDTVVPGAVFGVLLAPASIPVEIAASIAWSNQIHVTGDAQASPRVPANLGIRTDGTVTARLDLPTDATARSGARWLGERWTVETGVDVTIPRGTAPPVWRVDHMAVVDVPTDLAEPLVVASRFAPRRHVAVRAAVDVEVVPGFLWLTGGYAWRSTATPADRMSPTTADLGGHTIGFGVEVAAGGFTATLGLQRSVATRTHTATTTAFGMDDPFDPVTTTAGLGRYTAELHVVGVMIEVADD